MQHRKELVHYSTDLELRIVALHCLFYKYPAWPLCVPCNTFRVLHMHEDLIWIWAAMPRSGDSDSALLSISLSLAVQGEISTSAISRLCVHSVVSSLMFSQIVTRPPRGTEQLNTEHQYQIQCKSGSWFKWRFWISHLNLIPSIQCSSIIDNTCQISLYYIL